MQISLNVFCLEDESQIDAQEAGITINLDDCELREFTFFQIDYICPVKNKPAYCTVSSGAEDFLVDQPYEKVKQMIRDSKICNFN